MSSSECGEGDIGLGKYDGNTTWMIRSAESDRRALRIGCGRWSLSRAEGPKALEGWRQERTEIAW